MYSLLLALLMIGGTVLVSLAGVILVRRKVSVEILRNHHDVAAAFISVLGVIFAVLLAFVVFVVWNNYEETKVTVIDEENALGDLFSLSQAMPAELRISMRKAIIRYANSVIFDEWKTMADGKPSPTTQVAMKDLWNLFISVQPTTENQKALLTASLERLSDMSNSRRQRLHDAEDRIPTMMWILLWMGTITTITFTYFFGVESARSQFLMTAALAGQVAFILFLIAALDVPFRGIMKIEPSPLIELLHRIETYY